MENNFTLKFENGYSLIVKNCHEVYGHDDSLPYNADFTLTDKKGVCLMEGKAWNDGWGGSTSIQSSGRKSLKEVDEFMDKHLSYDDEKYKFRMTMRLNDVIDYLMDIYLGNEEQLGGNYTTEELFHNYLKGGEFRFFKVKQITK